MDKIIEDQIRALAKRETTYQIIIAVLVVMAVISFMTTHFDRIIKAGPSLQKIIKFFQGRWFSRATFEKDMRDGLNNLMLQNNLHAKKLTEIEKELKHNGGSSVKDAVIRLEEKVEHLKGLRDISDRFDMIMKFKYDPEQGVTSISESFLDAFGCKESDVLFYAFAELLHPDDRAEMWAKWQRSCEKKTPFVDAQRIRDHTGGYIRCRVKAKPIIINGKIKEFVGVIELNTI